MVARSSLRLDMTAEYSEAVDLLERMVRFARALEELGLEVRITGDLAVVIDTAVASQVRMDELLEEPFGGVGPLVPRGDDAVTTR